MSWKDATERLLGSAMRAFAHHEIIVYHPTGRSAIAFNDPARADAPQAVFTAEYHFVDADIDEVGVSTTAPVLGVRVSDLPALPKQDEFVEVGDVRYRVRDVHPDGEGGALLELTERD